MHDEAPPELSDLLDQIAFFLAQPLNFTSTDPETTETKVRILTAAAYYFNILSVREFGGRLGTPRDHGLVEQVVAAAFQTFGGVDPHPGPFDKAAMLLRGITQGHPFNDGNKRTGFLVAVYFLELWDILHRSRFQLLQSSTCASPSPRERSATLMLLPRDCNNSGQKMRQLCSRERSIQ
jgi:prophage maintenance system killer protein